MTACPECGRDRSNREPHKPTCSLDPEAGAKLDRSWWRTVYKAGIKADLDKQPRTPPADLTDDQKDVWLEGYDR